MPARLRIAIVVSFLASSAVLTGPTAQAQAADQDQNAAGCSCVCAEISGSDSAGSGTAATENEDGNAADQSAITDPAATENDPGAVAAAAEPGAAAESTVTDEPPALRLSELLPDPVGRDTDGEFIELENYGSAAAGLGGCLLSIPGKRDRELPEIILGSHELYYFLYAETGLALTNGGATLQLTCADRLLSNVSYPAAKEGSAYAIDAGGVWRWTTEPTPGRSNSFPAAPTAEELAATAVSDTTTANDVTGEGTVTSSTGSADPAGELPAAGPAAGPSVTAVAINEFLPDPVGSDDAEWIELRNDGGSPVDLAGWRLDDAEGGSSPYVFPAAAAIATQGVLVIPRAASGISLNNDGDQVRLFDAAGQPVSEVFYGPSREGRTYAWNGEAWVWSDPTPGLRNAFAAATAVAAEPDGPVAADVPTGVPADEPAQAPPLAVADAIALSESGLVTVRGVVNIAPGTIGKTIFGIQDPDGAAGLTVRLYGAPEQQPAFGDEIEVSGRLTDTSLGPRLNVSSRTGLRIIRSGVALDPKVVELTDLPDLDGPLLVNLSGEVTKTGQTWFKLVDESGEDELLVRFSRSQLAQDLKISDRVDLVGVWRRRSATQELFLARPPRRLPEPAAVPAGNEAPVAAPVTIGLAPVAEMTAGRPGTWLWPLTAAAAAAAAAGGTYLIRRRKNMFGQELAADVDK